MRALIIALALLALVACAATEPQAAPPTALPTPSATARGASLFVNKGCITCHAHAELTFDGTIIGVGPELTRYQNSAAFLRDWLRSPAAVRPNTAMPTLGLADDEIDALIAFLNREQP